MPRRKKTRPDFFEPPRGGSPRPRRRGRGAEGSQGLYTIGVVAERYDVHPQTLRLYERAGLLVPARTKGDTRLYSDENLETLEFILNLARNLGVNLAGIEVVLHMRARMLEMRAEVERLMETLRREFSEHRPSAGAGALVPVRRTPRTSYESKTQETDSQASREGRTRRP